MAHGQDPTLRHRPDGEGGSGTVAGQVARIDCKKSINAGTCYIEISSSMFSEYSVPTIIGRLQVGKCDPLRTRFIARCLPLQVVDVGQVEAKANSRLAVLQRYADTMGNPSLTKAKASPKSFTSA